MQQRGAQRESGRRKNEGREGRATAERVQVGRGQTGWGGADGGCCRRQRPLGNRRMGSCPRRRCGGATEAISGAFCRPCNPRLRPPTSSSSEAVNSPTWHRCSEPPILESSRMLPPDLTSTCNLDGEGVKVKRDSPTPPHNAVCPLAASQRWCVVGGTAPSAAAAAAAVQRGGAGPRTAALRGCHP